MIDRLQLSLMIGPAVPLPVGRDVLDALTEVTVTSNTEGPSVFELSFQVDGRSPLATLFMLSAGAVPPMIRVVVVVTLGGTSEVLMDGVMTDHQLSPGSGGSPATLTVTGEDLRRVMDYIDFDGIPYPALPMEGRVALILAKYAPLGVVPIVVPPILPDIPNPLERIPRHKGTDLQYIEDLAREVGYTFYVEPGPKPGISKAYWGPEVRVGVPQKALNVDMDAHTNVESLSFRYDSQSQELPVLYIQNQLTKVPIPIPVPGDLSPLRPPLGLVPPLPKQFGLLEGTAKMSPVRAAAVGLATAARSSDAVTGSGNLDVLRYGRVLKARQLVGVRGAGAAFDGLHYVNQVSHSIQRGTYKQSFSLSRNGLLPTVPRVPP